MDNKRMIILLVLSIITVIVATVGVTFAFLSVSDEQTDPNNLTITCFDISYTDKNIISLNSNGNYAYPMSESAALSKLTPYEFTITNNCTTENASQGIKYDITLNTLTATPSSLTSYLNYKLNTTLPTIVVGTTSNLMATEYDLNATIKLTEGIDSSYFLATGTLAQGESVTYNLYLWIDEQAGNDVMGESFTGKVLVNASM